jgi:hypothetical protein
MHAVAGVGIAAGVAAGTSKNKTKGARRRRKDRGGDALLDGTEGSSTETDLTGDAGAAIVKKGRTQVKKTYV